MASSSPEDRPPVTLLAAADSDRGAGVLARAFTPDPLWAAVMPDDETRPAKLEKMFRALIPTVRADKGLVTTTGLAAVAAWLPPGRKMGPGAIVRSRFAIVRTTLAMPADEIRRMMGFMRQLDGRHKALVPDPHWYLMAIGVEPDRQGRGLGSALVRDGLDRADADGAAVYLETETEDNVGFYEHLGFGVVEEVVAKGVDVPLWLMTRPPSS